MPLLLASLVLAQVSNSQDDLERVRSLYPAALATLSADCPAPATLSAVTYQTSEGEEYASLNCWNPAQDNGSRTGLWLGRLPLREGGTAFAQPLVCPPGDDRCAELWPQMQALYPSAVAQAEFHCAIKTGILFLDIQPDQVDVRCGFFATQLWDATGDGEVDYEDPVSLDVSVTLLPLPKECGIGLLY